MPCSNPDCPEHGESARKIKQAMVTNKELMDFLRTLAVNVYAATGGVTGMDSLVKRRMHDIITGAADHDHVMQGLIGGFMRTMQVGHPQVQEFLGRLADVPESEGYLARARKQFEAEYENGPFRAGGPFGVASFGSVDELMSFLKSLR